METRKAAFMFSSELEKYPYPPQCPFDTSRAAKTRKVLNSMGLLKGRDRSEVAYKPAERVFLKKNHSARYLHALKIAGESKFNAEALDMGIGTPDCAVFKGMYEAAALACGGTLAGADLILSNSADVVFHPAGGLHHAGAERASGFCYLNDVALACHRLAEEDKRVLYLDVDVHHGDGVQNAFYARNDVMTISFHQNGRTLFPGTGFADEIGIGAGKGYSVNVPLPVGTYDQAYMQAFRFIAIPLIKSYEPDVIVFELGADALAGDPLAHLCLTNNVYADIINHLLSFNIPILATGGGGYNIENTVRAWALAWAVLCGEDSSKKAIGLCDEQLHVSDGQRNTVLTALGATIEKIKTNVFGIHGL